MVCIDNQVKSNTIVSLQNTLIESKDKKLEVFIETVNASNTVGEDYQQIINERDVNKYEQVKTIEKITTNTVFTNLCISDAGVQYYNTKYGDTTDTSASEPTGELSRSSGVD